ncbi:hypothetical protein BDV95DRAFT_587912 [Massariosphaeria phaeospora]|uniref:Uncharacterized protein n=1 Tax=Massariosphaeria phaeospora TaxID=100035 RepID=A0A7C8M193_9PLEO|nr:hypothetical protein BDV95DRAFT_587912 [Massariosphaeria phaeospora]
MPRKGSRRARGQGQSQSSAAAESQRSRPAQDNDGPVGLRGFLEEQAIEDAEIAARLETAQRTIANLDVKDNDPSAQVDVLSAIDTSQLHADTDSTAENIAKKQQVADSLRDLLERLDYNGRTFMQLPDKGNAVLDGLQKLHQTYEDMYGKVVSAEIEELRDALAQVKKERDALDAANADMTARNQALVIENAALKKELARKQ